ncbi:MAG: hypothetical protein ACTSX9_06035 [Candidatus Njordarchaeales archaeon]
MTKDKKKRRSFFDDIFGGSFFDEIDRLFEEAFRDFASMDMGGSGYSIEVVYVNGRPVVKARLSEDMDREEFERMLRERYPEAEIIIEGGREKIKAIRREPERKRVEITLVDEEKKEVKNKDSVTSEKSKESIFDLIHGRRRVFIKREDEE